LIVCDISGIGLSGIHLLSHDSIYKFNMSIDGNLKVVSIGHGPDTGHQSNHKTDSVRFNGHSPGEPGLAVFIEAKDDGSGGDN